MELLRVQRFGPKIVAFATEIALDLPRDPRSIHRENRYYRVMSDFHSEKPFYQLECRLIFTQVFDYDQ